MGRAPGLHEYFITVHDWHPPQPLADQMLTFLQLKTEKQIAFTFELNEIVHFYKIYISQCGLQNIINFVQNVLFQYKTPPVGVFVISHYAILRATYWHLYANRSGKTDIHQLHSRYHLISKFPKLQESMSSGAYGFLWYIYVMGRH